MVALRPFLTLLVQVGVSFIGGVIGFASSRVISALQPSPGQALIVASRVLSEGMLRTPDDLDEELMDLAKAMDRILRQHSEAGRIVSIAVAGRGGRQWNMHLWRKVQMSAYMLQRWWMHLAFELVVVFLLLLCIVAVWWTEFLTSVMETAKESMRTDWAGSISLVFALTAGQFYFSSSTSALLDKAESISLVGLVLWE